MKLKVLVVDNDEKDPNVDNMKEWIYKNFPGSQFNQIKDYEFQAGNILTYKPDIMIVDVALKKNEENHLRSFATDSTKNLTDKQFSGIDYCLKLKSNFSHLPVILSSQFYDSRILSASIEAGADGFLHKTALSEDNLISALEATFYRYRTDDISFYQKLRELIYNGANDIWERERIILALESFYTKGSGFRRLSGLWCNLATLVETLLPTKTVNKLLSALMDAEALMLSSHPRMRDHIRHAGNVFWLGYYFLNSIPAFKSPEKLHGSSENTYHNSENTPFEQLNMVWVLCSLLHDIGYVEEQIDKIEKKINHCNTEFFNYKIKTNENHKDKIKPDISLLQPYLSSLGDKGARLYSAIATTIQKWGETVDDDSIKDHGVISASAFTGSLKRNSKECLEKPEILHAAAAMSLHNLSKWNKLWPEPGGIVDMPIGILPCAWLLGYCDELQGWGREPESDVYDLEINKDLSKTRRKYLESYIEGSRISTFNITSEETYNLKIGIEIAIQYMMVQGTNTTAVHDDVRDGIQIWQRDRAPLLRKTLGLDKLLKTTIKHLIPGPISEPIVVELN